MKQQQWQEEIQMWITAGNVQIILPEQGADTSEFMKFSWFSQREEMTMIYPALVLSYWGLEKWAI